MHEYLLGGILIAAGIVYLATGLTPMQVWRLHLRATNPEYNNKLRTEFNDLLQ